MQFKCVFPKSIYFVNDAIYGKEREKMSQLYNIKNDIVILWLLDIWSEKKYNCYQ